MTQDIGDNTFHNADNCDCVRCNPELRRPNLQKPVSRAAEKREKSKAKLKAWLEVRRAVFARDGHLCRVCGAREHIDVHHITRRSAGGQDTLENCLALCRICHADVHAYRLFLVRDPNLRFIRAPK